MFCLVFFIYLFAVLALWFFVGFERNLQEGGDDAGGSSKFTFVAVNQLDLLMAY